MKSTVSHQPCTKETPFPKLMISTSTNTIALAISATMGIIVGNTDIFNYVGKHLTTLNPDYWKDYHGSVCLEND